MSFYLHNWLKETVYRELDRIKDRTITTPVLAKKVTSLNKPQLVKIRRFLNFRLDHSLSTSVSDKDHQVYAIITKEAIDNFENETKQRITYKTVNTIMEIEDSDLKFASATDLVDFNVEPVAIPKVDIVLLVIHKLKIFQRNQEESPFIGRTVLYDELEYIKRCTKEPDGKVKTEIKLMKNDIWDIKAIADNEAKRGMIE